MRRPLTGREPCLLPEMVLSLRRVGQAAGHREAGPDEPSAAVGSPRSSPGCYCCINNVSHVIAVNSRMLTRAGAGLSPLIISLYMANCSPDSKAEAQRRQVMCFELAALIRGQSCCLNRGLPGGPEDHSDTFSDPLLKDRACLFVTCSVT